MYKERFSGPYVHVTNDIHHEKMRMININVPTTNKKTSCVCSVHA